MEPLNIVKDNNSLLRKKSVDVNIPLSNEDEETINKMFNYLLLTQDEKYREKYKKVREGVGLAAPQIGILKKMIVINFKEKEENISHALINPTIISTSSQLCYLKSGEGCLSVDKDVEGIVLRHNKIRVKGYDYFKKENVIIVAKGFDAIVLQHEIDHLNGILFYDRINKFDPFLVPDGTIRY